MQASNSKTIRAYLLFLENHQMIYFKVHDTLDPAILVLYAVNVHLYSFKEPHISVIIRLLQSGRVRRCFWHAAPLYLFVFFVVYCFGYRLLTLIVSWCLFSSSDIVHSFCQLNCFSDIIHSLQSGRGGKRLFLTGCCAFICFLGC